MRYTGRTPWDVLGVAEGASFSDVKRAYFRRARETHPDARGGSAEVFREVQAAFDALERHAPRDETPARPARPARPTRSQRPARRTPYDSWIRPPRRARQWLDNDPLVTGSAAARTETRRLTFAGVLARELGGW
jgi:curved DNA-binding protein CbpA